MSWVRAIALVWLVPASALAQGPLATETATGADAAPKKAIERPGTPEIDTSCIAAEEFGGTVLERAGWCAFQQSSFVNVRKLAGDALHENDRSFRAHYLMGAAQHLGEGNLPKSLHHLHAAEDIYVGQHGLRPSAVLGAPVFPYRRILLELVYVHGEMDHHEEKIRYVDALQDRLSLDYSPLKAWPLLKLKRFDEARVVANAAIEQYEDDSSYWRAIALTALCAIESEMRRREAAYEACRAAAEPVLTSPAEGGVALSNAAAASMEMFRFDEAERLYNEATRRPIEGTINPWGRLAHLYLRQGRFAEALSALRAMHRYRNARPSYFDQQDQADADVTGASVLIVAGLMEDALRITSRVIHRPDRQGTSSAAAEQNEAGNLIVDRVVKLEVARRLEEEASWSKWRDAVGLRFEALQLRIEAWIQGRRAGQILSSTERLTTSLRPECPGSVELPAWLDGEVVRVVGPGVSLAAIAESRAEETLPAELAEPLFRGFEAEAHLLAGDHERALEDAEYAIDHLPPVETLVRARCTAIAAASAAALGETQRMMGYLERVLSADPGLVRRFGLTLPARIALEGSSPAVMAAAELIRSSPLFEIGDAGFEIALGEDTVALRLPDGNELMRARVPKGKGDEDGEALARRIVKTAHRELLVPQVDVTQADVRSLDGGLTGGGRASERAKSVMEEVLESK